MSKPAFGTLLVEITGINRSGVAKGSGNSYCMYQGFVHLPHVPYPQQVDFYAASVSEAPAIGTYEVDIMPTVRDGRVQFDFDPRQGRKKDLPPLHAAMSKAV